MEFRDRFLATLRAIRPVLEQEGVLVIGSEVPNLLEKNVASTLVVSEDVDIGVAIEHHARVKGSLSQIVDLKPSAEEPSVWVPSVPDSTLLEVNFVGIDRAIRDPSETYVFDDPVLPLMVFAPLSFLKKGTPVEVDGLLVPVPKPAGLILEKLATDRTGRKGDRDLLVVIGLLLNCSSTDVEEVCQAGRMAPDDLRHMMVSNLSILSLLDPSPFMPDPTPHRALIADMIERILLEDP